MPENPPRGEPEKKRRRSKPLPEELARDAIAHEQIVVGGKVRMTFRVALSRQHAEVLAARAIRKEKSLEALVTELLEEAVTTSKAGRQPSRKPEPKGVGPSTSREVPEAGADVGEQQSIHISTATARQNRN